MVSRDRFKAVPLLGPGAASSDARMTGHVLANALRQSYLYAQSQGRMCGIQTYLEQHFFESGQGRSFSDSDFNTIAIFRAHLPPWTRALTARIGFQGFAEGPECLAHHRISVNYGGNTDVGIETIDQVPSSGGVFSIVSPLAGVDPGDDGVFGMYDLVTNETECTVELEDVVLDDANEATITVSAYTLTTDVLSVTASESERDSADLVTATVPPGHHFLPGMLIWTENFDDNVPQGSPVAVDSVSGTTISWILNGPSDATFGEGTIYTSTGLPVVYRPGVVSCWWEF